MVDDPNFILPLEREPPTRVVIPLCIDLILSEYLVEKEKEFFELFFFLFFDRRQTGRERSAPKRERQRGTERDGEGRARWKQKRRTRNKSKRCLA